ncbi:MAG: YdjY domain-containing protein [Planctomycetia bacterium]|nr:YdjY domain-containing protein [Planctomycetia bacterium]
MKLTILSLVGATLLMADGGWQGANAQPKEEPKPEALPEYPLLNPKNKLVDLSPDKKLAGEVSGEGKNRRVVRIGIVTEVCLREGPLEVFLCKKGTKEHESPLRVDMDAQLIHQALIVAGGDAGKPTQFIDPKTEEAKYAPATGSKIKITLHYKLNGKLQTCPAQDWIWDIKKKAPIPHTWVFAGSMLVPNPNDPNAKPFYGANSGDIFSISNFPYAMLEFPVEITKDDAQLTYEAKTDKIPPLASKVWMILEVIPAKK